MTGIPNTNTNSSIDPILNTNINNGNIPNGTAYFATAAASSTVGHAGRACTLQDDPHDLSLERMIACLGYSRFHTVNALAKTDHEDRPHGTTIAHSITDRKMSHHHRVVPSVGYDGQGVVGNHNSSTGSNNIPSNNNDLDHFSYSCLMSISPVVSETSSTETAIVTDRDQDTKHHHASSNITNITTNNNNNNNNMYHLSRTTKYETTSNTSTSKLRKHNYYQPDHHHQQHHHHHTNRFHKHRSVAREMSGKNVTHYVIQLEPMEGRKRLCSTASFSSTTTNTTVQALKLGLSKEDFRKQRQNDQLLMAALHHQVEDHGVRNNDDNSTLASSSSDQIVVTCG